MNGVGPHADASIGLPAQALQAVFPFHCAFDRDLHIVQAAPSLRKLVPALTLGYKLSDYFRIATPNVPFEFEAISQQSFTVFFIESLDARFKLKGQMLRTQSGAWDLIIFLGSPLVREMSSVSSLGLTLRDFAIHDPVVDLLILLQTKTNTINDVKNMAERLKKEVAERREAQQALQHTNEQLEARVSERTRALESANSDLQLEIAEHARAEERVRVANARLQTMLTRLEEHNRQMVLLNAMGDQLQACRSVNETHAVIADSLARLLPGESGFLTLRGEDARYHVVAAWGTSALAPGVSFDHEDCWGLRRARMHEHVSGDNASVCAHVRRHCEQPDIRHACIPLATQGELHGLLHLHGLARPGSADAPELENDRRQLLHSAAEHISLAIANLKLQEHLRQQSIRDILTGLYNRRHMEEALLREAARADRQKLPCSILMLDVDHFKKFNDSYGHQAGDALLRGLGSFLQTHVRGEDVACRYGGEEFILILPGADPENALRRGEQIRAGVADSLKVAYEADVLPQVTISLGLATYPLHAQTAADAVKAADVALYRAKRAGRNRVAVSDGTLEKTD